MLATAIGFSLASKRASSRRSSSGVGPGSTTFFGGSAGRPTVSSSNASSCVPGSAPAAEPAATPGRQDGQSPDGGGAGAGAGSNNSATPPVLVNQEALPDGVRLLLQFGEGGTAAGTLTRDIRLIHP